VCVCVCVCCFDVSPVPTHAPKFLHGVRSYGITHPVNVLRGSNSKKTKDLGHNKLKFYGKGHSHSPKFWSALSRMLVHKGYIVESKGEYITVGTSAKGLDFLTSYEQRSAGDKPRLMLELSNEMLELEEVERGRKAAISITMKPSTICSASPSGPVAAIFENSKSMKSRTVSSQRISDQSKLLSPLEKELQAALRKLRTATARAKGVANFAIFDDRTLLLMVQIRPTTNNNFARIEGIGDAKLANYGDRFIKAIQEFCQHHKLDTNCFPAHVEVTSHLSASGTRVTTIDTEQQNLDWMKFSTGKSCKQIALERGCDENQVRLHLLQVMEGTEVSHHHPIINFWDRFGISSTDWESCRNTILTAGEDAQFSDIQHNGFSEIELRLVKLRMTVDRELGSKKRSIEDVEGAIAAPRTPGAKREEALLSLERFRHPRTPTTPNLTNSSDLGTPTYSAKSSPISNSHAGSPMPRLSPASFSSPPPTAYQSHGTGVGFISSGVTGNNKMSCSHTNSGPAGGPTVVLPVLSLEEVVKFIAQHKGTSHSDLYAQFQGCSPSEMDSAVLQLQEDFAVYSKDGALHAL